MRDAVIVRGSLAAGRLRHHDVVLLESGDRVGGRIRSERRGDHHLTWGGYVLAGAPTSGTSRPLGRDRGATPEIPGDPHRTCHDRSTAARRARGDLPVSGSDALALTSRDSQGEQHGGARGPSVRPGRGAAQRTGTRPRWCSRFPHLTVMENLLEAPRQVLGRAAAEVREERCTC